MVELNSSAPVFSVWHSSLVLRPILHYPFIEFVKSWFTHLRKQISENKHLKLSNTQLKRTYSSNIFIKLCFEIPKHKLLSLTVRIESISCKMMTWSSSGQNTPLNGSSTALLKAKLTLTLSSNSTGNTYFTMHCVGTHPQGWSEIDPQTVASSPLHPQLWGFPCLEPWTLPLVWWWIYVLQKLIEVIGFQDRYGLESSWCALSTFLDMFIIVVGNYKSVNNDYMINFKLINLKHFFLFTYFNNVI